MNTQQFDAAIAFANKVNETANEGTLANWLDEIAMLQRNEYLSVDVSMDERNDSYEEDAEELGYSEGDNMSVEHGRQLGYEAYGEALDERCEQVEQLHAGEEVSMQNVLDNMAKAVLARAQWLMTR